MTTANHSQTKILIVEDDTFLAGMYVTKLGMEHFATDLASDGKSGLEKAKKFAPDLILLDVLLPKLNGFDVLRSLKREPSTRHIPVILLTNLGQKSDVLKGLELGASDYLIKAHFMPSEVVDKIKQTLRRAHPRSR
ncbi:MAG: response regulator [Candidatus Kerfeldbacteria bacterium]|nr:response regulator [Candidatus Kerfeldbacteria bacterium]